MGWGVVVVSGGGMVVTVVVTGVAGSGRVGVVWCGGGEWV